ncbi:macrolide family glycosyltransferase [Paenibacillus thailandensis]|uniref:Macrolide family glycosyltransferase n=1 Tax=Paenibacillus thailandensis TaxID=393250 RepID=A0ABW5R4A1_9BACL
MARVLFIGGPAESHVHPTLPLVRELVRLGEEVVYFCSQPYEEEIKQAGAEFRAYANFLAGRSAEELGHFTQFIRLLLDSADIVIPGVMERIKGETFDYAIHDSLFGWGRAIAQKLGIPSVSVSVGFVYTGKKPPTFGETWATKWRNFIEGGTFFRESKRLFRELGERHGVPVPDFGNIYYQKADLNIAFTSSLFQPYSERLDRSFVFIGPAAAQRREPVSFPFERLDGRTLVYISMGTILAGKEAFFGQCIEAFRNAPYQVVMSVGKQTDLSRFADAPSHFIIRHYVPQLELLKKTQIMICHGGMNSTMEALYHDIPVIVVPQSSDQPIVAARVEQLGCGIAIPKEKVSADKLGKAVDAIMNDRSYRTKAAKVGESLRQSGGIDKAIREIGAFKRKFLAAEAATFKLPVGKAGPSAGESLGGQYTWL